MPFEISKRLIEPSPLPKTPANPDNLTRATMPYYAGKNGEILSVAGLFFDFDGLQYSFSISDLTDLKLTLNGNEIEFSLHSNVSRNVSYREYSNDFTTSYTLDFKETYSTPGKYKITGKYRGKAFESDVMTIK